MSYLFGFLYLLLGVTLVRETWLTRTKSPATSVMVVYLIGLLTGMVMLIGQSR